MLYDLTTLSFRFGTLPQVLAGIEAWEGAPDAPGKLAGGWNIDIGTLNHIMLLRAYADRAELEVGRARLRATTDPFHCGAAIGTITQEAYAPFPFMGDIEPGAFGAVYEIRTYHIVHGGLAPTIAAWAAAVPERTKLSRLSMVMYSLDGPLRMTHFWPYASTNERAEMRAAAVQQGIWPPKGGPTWLTGQMQSSIGLPLKFSPLR
ncbi:MAG: NIPSNAP family protein [Hyphomicrobiales bacterium]|nr:NIPSNAP family protein [Hyphomicrobiales bacterium]